MGWGRATLDEERGLRIIFWRRILSYILEDRKIGITVEYNIPSKGNSINVQ